MSENYHWDLWKIEGVPNKDSISHLAPTNVLWNVLLMCYGMYFVYIGNEFLAAIFIINNMLRLLPPDHLFTYVMMFNDLNKLLPTALYVSKILEKYK